MPVLDELMVFDPENVDTDKRHLVTSRWKAKELSCVSPFKRKIHQHPVVTQSLDDEQLGFCIPGKQGTDCAASPAHCPYQVFYSKRLQGKVNEVLEYLVLRCGILYEQAYLNWCNEAVAVIAANEDINTRSTPDGADQ